MSDIIKGKINGKIVEIKSILAEKLKRQEKKKKEAKQENK
jgi:hypothetical protein